MDTSQYLDLFLDESREHLQSINTTLLELEQAPDNLELVQTIFRSAHTLKGMAASMNFEFMTTLTHRMENVLDAIRNGEVAVSEDIVDSCFEALDGLSQMVDQISSGGNDHYDIEHLTKELESHLSSKAKDTGGQPASSVKKKQGTAARFLKGEFPDYVVDVIEQSFEQNLNVYSVHVELEANCQLKGVRAFMVNQVLEQHGEILASKPAADLLQEGQFDLTFSLLMVAQESSDVWVKEIKNIMEVASVEIDAIHSKDIHAPDPKTDKKADEAKSPSKQQKASNAQNGTKTLRVNIERMDALMNLFEELIIERGRLEGLSKRIKDMHLTESVERLVRTSSDLRDVILNLRMVPIEQVFNRFPRMVRSVAKDLNKQIKLVITGQETELDRTVIDEIGDPLVHLLRNSMDHGIELPEGRQRQNKPEEGSIFLRAYHQGNFVYIEIEDDGAGINRDGVLKKAISNQLISKDEADKLSDQEVYALLFRSGFSTAEKLSDLSGRGVGLDVVKSKIEALGGKVEVTSTPGKGSLFTIQLPMTLSIISAMLFKVGEETYAMPLSSILETQMIEEESLLKVQNSEMVSYRDRVIPFIRLHQYLDLSLEEKKQKTPVLIVRKGSQLAALTVEKLIGQQEIVIKPLGGYFKNLPGYSGATILGDGHVSLILDPAAFIN